MAIFKRANTKTKLLKHIQKIKAKLFKKNCTITFAESCTSGLLAREFGKCNGISSVFNGSIVSYSNDIKIKYLNVDKKTIKKHGVVSNECVEQMAKGAMSLFGADIAVGISGIAGSGGGSKKKPVGMVCICVYRVYKNRDKKANQTSKIINKTYYFKGTREEVQKRSVKKAIKMILQII